MKESSRSAKGLRNYQRKSFGLSEASFDSWLVCAGEAACLISCVRIRGLVATIRASEWKGKRGLSGQVATRLYHLYSSGLSEEPLIYVEAYWTLSLSSKIQGWHRASVEQQSDAMSAWSVFEVCNSEKYTNFKNTLHWGRNLMFRTEDAGFSRSSEWDAW